jgi:hypothetical protein
MATALKVLGQVAPLATTLTTLYAVPALTSTVCSSLVVCNTSATPTTFRISIAKAAAVDNIAQYLYYDVTIAGNDTFIATIGISLATTDVVRCYATLATISFSLYGQENT